VGGGHWHHHVLLLSSGRMGETRAKAQFLNVCVSTKSIREALSGGSAAPARLLRGPLGSNGRDSGPGAAVIEVLARQRIAGQRAGMPGASPIHGRFVSREKVNKLTASEPDGGEEQGLHRWVG